MCLAFTGKIISIENNSNGVVMFNGITKEVILDLLPDAAIGDFVLVHAGFAIQKVEFDENTNWLMNLIDESK
ncbi:HypC/HybG/HupF family hydrogenase formation chaperone [bacterium]|nr:HypC/HybG/HupF family hydrogenase formation chaperone [bacterium]